MNGEIASKDNDSKFSTTLNALCAIACGLEIKWKPSPVSIGIGSLSVKYGCWSINKALYLG